MPYDFWYWNGIPGRGEFVRLALEAARIPYRERTRAPDANENALMQDLQSERHDPPFAPPYLVARGITIAQTANILLFLGEQHALAPADTAGRYWVNQMQLTIGDAVAEAHDVHHPIAATMYYEDQKAEAARRCVSFRQERIPKFLNYFERILEKQGRWLAGGNTWTYADLSLFQLVDGLLFAYPRRMASMAGEIPNVMRLHGNVANLQELQDYFSSGRRLPYGAGIFRHYPELDGA